MKYEDVIARFEIAEDYGDGNYLAHCPAHDDSKPSLIIGPGEKPGYVALKCRAHCSFHDVAAAAGVKEPAVLSGGVTFPDGLTVVPKATRKPAVAEKAAMQARVDEYVDALLAQTGKPGRDYLRKRFGIDIETTEQAAELGVGYSTGEQRVTVTGRNPDGSVAFTQRRAIVTTEDHLKVLSEKKPAPDVDVPAVGFVGPRHPDADVVVCEGITDALAVAALDVYDVVCVAGAGNHGELADLADALAGRTVFVAGDGDASGRVMTREAAKVLAGIAEVRTVALPDKTDVADVVAEGGSEALSALLGTSTAPEISEPAEGRTKAHKVIEHVEDNFDVIKADDGGIYVVPKKGARFAQSLDALRGIVADDLYTADGTTVGATTIADAFAVIEARGRKQAVTPIYLRAAQPKGEDAVYIDLGDPDLTVVKVTAEGWSVAEPGETPVFRRMLVSAPLPTPVRGDSEAAKSAFVDLLMLDDVQAAIVWGWLTAAFFEDIERPLLWATGAMGSGKTTRMEMVLGLVDPVEHLGAPPGKNERDDNVRVAGRFVPSFDNIGNISAATSDWICRLVTGVSIESRVLYKMADLHVFTVKRTAVATSVNLPYGLGPDALERTVVLDLHRIASYASERDLWAAFDALAGSVLAALLDDMVGIMARLRDVPEDVRLHRLADYHRTLLALDLHTGGQHADAFVGAGRQRMAERVEDDPWLSAIMDIVRGSADGHVWLTPTDWERRIAAVLKSRDATLTDREVRENFPKARGLKKALRANEVGLADVGIGWDERKRGSKGVYIYILPGFEDTHEPVERVPYIHDAMQPPTWTPAEPA